MPKSSLPAALAGCELAAAPEAAPVFEVVALAVVAPVPVEAPEEAPVFRAVLAPEVVMDMVPDETAVVAKLAVSIPSTKTGRAQASVQVDQGTRIDAATH
jgi:hypothetical protein